MKKSLSTVALLVLLITPAFVTAQLNHFIYLQTEAKQPFYAKLDKKVLSSSVSGYLIIPKLKDGTYNITIGFPKNENAEQTFVCTIDNRDAGYLVKNFGDKGWGLFNLQTLDVVMSGADAKEKDVVTVEKTDEFSNMLSTVVNDPSIKQEEVPVQEIKKAPEVKAATVAAETVETASMPDSTVAGNVAEAARPFILKQQTITSDKGTEIVYIDMGGDQPDTIGIFIPKEKSSKDAAGAEKTTTAKRKPEASLPVVEVSNPGTVAAEDKKEDNPEKTFAASGTIPDGDARDSTAPAKEVPGSILPVVDSVFKTPETAMDIKAEERQDSAVIDSKFLPIEMNSSNPTVNTSENEKPAVRPMVNSDCKDYASEEDFLKLRKKMASADNDDDMIATAHKYFKSKCYTTDQVKNLGVLFLTDDGKYRFFDLAYQYVSDSHNFPGLESQLTEAYYISRFKAMIRH